MTDAARVLIPAHQNGGCTASRDGRARRPWRVRCDEFDDGVVRQLKAGGGPVTSARPRALRLSTFAPRSAIIEPDVERILTARRLRCRLPADPPCRLPMHFANRKRSRARRIETWPTHLIYDRT
ncbi:uncharacterized protein PSFLO_03421 [Pseudozyma flocculosa]|uniref:Uncharacterized protein n=1 Tax=Pseudozyma flocculosa TaxID=84751 RepID=A0A5C3F0A1_9BASI|nr:uncharacterized protein PSFLO_03421 [Pseudozyma flocculosa]